jgi:Tfp pilus assembly protein PilX
MMLSLRARNDEEGIVMVTVLLVTFILLVLVTGTLGYALGSQPLSRRDQDWNAALSAAEAGLDDYLYRLNQNDQYYLYGAAPTSLACGIGLALTAPPDGNLAFSQFVAVPGATSNATFRYSVDTSCVSQGAILVWSTGKAANVTRTVEATIRRRSFLDFLYFTDYETKDPASYGSNDDYTATEAQTYCALHYYEGRDIDNRVDFAGDSDGDTCTDITFVTGDAINGPLHSNDAILLSGSPAFNGKVTTSWQGGCSPLRRYRVGSSSCGTATPTFANNGDPTYADPLTMPPSNLALKVKADASSGTGCLYTGPTSITLNSTGTMTVDSPGTVSNSSSSAVSISSCVGTNKPLPTNGVIYVQNVPANTADPNYFGACRTRTQIGGTATVQHPLGYPQLYDDVTQYGCTDGDAFLSGVLKGRLTIAADNNIDIIGSVTYQSGAGGSDLLGLVANNYVEIYHPVTNTAPVGNLDGNQVSGYYNLDTLPIGVSTAFHDPIVQAAILSVQHSFRVQNYQYGDNNLGSITVYGGIAQKYRGVVGTGGNSGYLKNYNYDPRLKYQSPPFFLNPLDSAWQIVTWVECKGTSNGTVPTTCQ